MILKQDLTIVLLASQLFTWASAVPLIEARDGVCSNGIYGELSPILKNYPIALAFCSAVYPVPCTAAVTKRATSSLPAATSSALRKAPATTTTTAAKDAKAAAWLKCQKQPGNVVKTICSCIETPKACTPKTSSKSTTTTTKSRTITTTKPSSTTTSTTTTSTTTTSTTTTSSTTSTTSTTTTTTASTTTSTTTSTTATPSMTTTTTTTIAATPTVAPVSCDYATVPGLRWRGTAATVVPAVATFDECQTLATAARVFRFDYDTATLNCNIGYQSPGAYDEDGSFTLGQATNTDACNVGYTPSESP